MASVLVIFEGEHAGCKEFEPGGEKKLAVGERF